MDNPVQSSIMLGFDATISRHVCWCLAPFPGLVFGLYEHMGFPVNALVLFITVWSSPFAHDSP